MTASDTTVGRPPIAVVDPEFAGLIPPLSNQERELLEGSLMLREFGAVLLGNAAGKEMVA